MKRTKHLLIIGGTGRNAGKTALAVQLIERFTSFGVSAVKITPHLHPDYTGLQLIIKNEGFEIYEECNRVSGKDTSRMLAAGADHVFLIISSEQFLMHAFDALIKFMPENVPLICESPALRRFFEPDLFFIMKHSNNSDTEGKKIDDLLPLASIVLTMKDIDAATESIGLDENNCWIIRDN